MIDEQQNSFNLVCPPLIRNNKNISLGHGSGGFLTHELIKDIFNKYFANPILDEGNDGAVVDFPLTEGKMVVSTDAHIISPLFYPGGDIGRLAVSGTVNDIAMMGAKPLFLTASFIIEEGFPVESLDKIASSMKNTCEEAGVKIIAGDTKVTEKGKGDGIYISTTGVGWLPEGRNIQGQNAIKGDAVIISGTIGDHATAILQARGGLGFQTNVTSDVSPLNQMLENLLQQVPDIHVMRDPTRGGLGTTLVEISQQSNVCIQIKENSLPIQREVKTVCEMLGFDPLYMANEGKVVIILPEEKCSVALDILHRHRYGQNAVRIGSVVDKNKARVLLQTPLGTNRVIEMLMGEMLPRIC